MKSLLQRIVRVLVIASPLVYPAYFFRFKLAGIPFTALEVFNYILFGLWLLAMVLRQAPLSWDKTTRRFWWAAFAILVGATIGLLAAPAIMSSPDQKVVAARQISLGVWKGWIVAPILYFAVLSQVLRAEKEVDRILRAMIYSGALVGLVSHGFALEGSGLAIDFRLRGFFESANQLALYLVPALLLGIHRVLSRARAETVWDYLDVASMTIMAYTLLFTRSYAGMLSVFGAVGLWVLIHLIQNKAHRKQLAVSLVVLVATFGIIIASQLRTEKFRQFLDFQNRSSTSVRVQLYEVAWDLVKSHPLIGVGPGLFQANYQLRAPVVLGQPPYEWDMPHPHNIILAFWLNSGLLGLAAFLTLLVLAHRRFTYPLIALWGILIHGLFDTPFWKNDLAMIFWLVIAAILTLQRLRKSA